MEKLVSIITLTRNRGKLIERAIKSVLNQSYSNIEYIIVDGASTDNTEEVVNKFINDNRLVYIRLDTNLPLVETMNFTIKNAKGDYVTFLDDDDEYLPTKIEKQVSLFQSLPSDYGLVYCWFCLIDDKTKKTCTTYKTKLRGFVPNEVVEKPTITGTPSLMYKKQVLEELGGWRDDTGIISDWELCARTCQKYKVDYVPEILVNGYTNHGMNQMTSRGYYSDRSRVIRFHELFMDEYKHIFDEYPRKAKYHLESLVTNCFRYKQYRNGYKWYVKLLKCCFSIKNLVRPIYSLLKSVV